MACSDKAHNVERTRENKVRENTREKTSASASENERVGLTLQRQGTQRRTNEWLAVQGRSEKGKKDRSQTKRKERSISDKV
jgi:hypothetical protein